MEILRSDHIIMTLDAGGTNFVFSAIKQAEEVVKPIVLPAYGHDLDKCLRNIIKGFEALLGELKEKPAAISFAFPGPADYARGIIGDLGNLPGFRGGVALGPMLEEHFKMPVFINNDGDLFAYGEAIYGLLPQVNKQLKEAGSEKQFENLVGLTLGTGFGGGLVRNNELFMGDNGAAAEVWLLRNPFDGNTFAEESISARSITGQYQLLAGVADKNLTPLDVYCIATGNKEGNTAAAKESFKLFGRALGMALAEIVTFVDGLVVIGGGLANARDLFFPSMLEEMNGYFHSSNAEKVKKLVMKVYDLHDDEAFGKFASGESRTIKVPYSSQEIQYDPEKRIGVGVSQLGASKAISLGACAFALNKLGL
ncbi:MAG: ROK family protein [Bacteroidetes bacterium]|nr:MAG: ROK family protein [Bacteroidota bacterium]